jgi:acetate kinase
VRVLTVNAGSTSLKLALVTGGIVETTPRSLDDALAADEPDCIAHRVVHGGPRTEATIVDNAVLGDLRALVTLAPLHQPPSLSAIEDCRGQWPDVPNVACFDTAFHTTIPPAARTYALPARYRGAVRVYGFHGLSYAWATSRLQALVPDARRALIAHLGGGQSLCGTVDGRSAITTMGFTPTDGLVMGTRSGSLDPGAVLWLAEHLDETADLQRLLEEQSGLMGLCGTADMREVHAAAAAGEPDAQLAFDVWRHRIVTLAGACLAALGGLDVLAFTGGIGENDPIARAALVDGLAWLGIAINDRATVVGDGEITASGSAVRCFVIAAREELQLAAEAAACLGQ